MIQANMACLWPPVSVAPNPRRVRILAAALRVTCNGGRPQVARPPVHPHVTRNGGVGPRHSSLSTSPSRTTLAASDPGVDHPQIPVFLGRNRHDDAVRPENRVDRSRFLICAVG